MITSHKPRILIASVQVPFTKGGAELLAESLRHELEKRGALTDIVQLPFSALPKTSLVQQMSYWRSLDLSSFNGMKVDLVIGTKFPSYMINHPNKVLWLIHQYRQAYDLYGTRFGDLSTSTEDESLRQMIIKADKVSLAECSNIYSISGNVQSRLKRYLDIESETLVPPLPLAGKYHHGEPQPYILSVGRICSIKRVDMIIKAMAQIDDRLKLKIVGLPDESEIESYINSEIDKHHLWHRIEFLGKVDDQALVDLFANAFFTYYAPYDEDLGFVTIESLVSGVPVLTAKDSGGSLAYVEHKRNGLIVDPSEQAMADAINLALYDTELYHQLRAGAKNGTYTSTWDEVIAKLTGGLLTQ